jgi:hypothetical protein
VLIALLDKRAGFGDFGLFDQQPNRLGVGIFGDLDHLSLHRFKVLLELGEIGEDLAVDLGFKFHEKIVGGREAPSIHCGVLTPFALAISLGLTAINSQVNAWANIEMRDVLRFSLARLEAFDHESKLFDDPLARGREVDRPTNPRVRANVRSDWMIPGA